MPDVQIARSGSGEVPLDYTLPGNSAFLLKAVQASFDGSGAAGAFLPCVTILSDAGLVIARAIDTAVSVAAGGSAEVSFFPHVKHAAGAAPVAAGLQWAVSAGGITIPSTANSSADSIQTTVVTNDSTKFDLFNDELRIKASGVYLVMATIHGQSTTVTDQRVVEMTILFDGSLTSSYQLLVAGVQRGEYMNYSVAAGKLIGIDQVRIVNIRSADLNEGVYTHVVTGLAPGAAVACNSYIGAVRLSDAIAGTLS